MKITGLDGESPSAIHSLRMVAWWLVGTAQHSGIGRRVIGILDGISCFGVRQLRLKLANHLRQHIAEACECNFSFLVIQIFDFFWGEDI